MRKQMNHFHDVSITAISFSLHKNRQHRIVHVWRRASAAIQRGDLGMQIDHKCAYGPCQCKVPEAGQYCSDHCSQADKLRAEGTQCSCGHEECKAAQGV
jgi:hypothetical protein